MNWLHFELALCALNPDLTHMSENLFQHVNFRESQIPLIGYQIMNPYTLVLSPIYNFNFRYQCLAISGIQHAIFDHLTKTLEKSIVIRKGVL